MSYDEFLTLFANAKTDEQETLVKIRCATDLDLYATAFFSHYCTREFNDYHRDYFESVKYGERNIRRVRAAPRGSAKSTLSVLIKPIHDVCYGLEKFILLIGSNAPLTNQKLKDIRMEVQQNSALHSMYGIRFSKKKVGESEFVVFSDAGRTYFTARGRGSEVRGIRVGEARPTKIILDDVEYSDEVYNEKIREKTESWYFEDVTKTGDSGTNIEFVGTVLHKDSLLSKLTKNPAYDSKLFKSIISWSEREDLWNNWRKLYRDLDNPQRVQVALDYYTKNEEEMLKGTQVLWPEKETYLDHMKDMEEIGKRAFMKEKQNDPQGADDSVFTQFHWYKEVEKGIEIQSNGAIIPWDQLTPMGAIDPATGQERQKGKGDYSVILIGYKHARTNRVFIHYDWTKRAPPTQFISKIFDLHEKFQFDKFAVETNLYRNLLLPNISVEKKAREAKTGKPIDISFYDVVQTDNKHERIYRLEPKVTNGQIVFNRSLSKEFMMMFESFPNKDSHDDAPDCAEILYSLANNRYPLAPMSINAMMNV